MRKKLIITFLCVSCMFLASGLQGARFSVPGEYDTIQGAIDAATDGDVVIVAPGIYRKTSIFWVRILLFAVSGRATGR
jgi:hypothetical protein